MPALTFPWPPPQLFPNFKRSHHWSKYHKQARNARTLGWGLTAEALGPNVRSYTPDSELRLTIEFTPPKRRGPTPDEDSALGACKHYLDGIASAIGVNDRHFRNERPVWRECEGAGKVVISF